MNALQRIAVLIGCLAVLVPPALAAPVVRATALLSQSVVSAHGRPIGELVDVLVDLSSGAAPYAVIERPDAGHHLYPLSALRLERGTLSVNEERGALAAETGRLLSVQRLIGRAVVFRGGGDAGEVRDVSINLGSGALESVTLAYEPVFGDPPVGVQPSRLHAPAGDGPLVLGDVPEPRPAQGILVVPSDERRTVQ